MADEKRRSGRDLPFLNWRYILFTWNDSDEEMNLARHAGRRDRRRSSVLGDHRPSGKRVTRAGSCPGSPALEAIRRETWDDNNLGNAIPGATPRARIDVRTLVPGLPLDGAQPAGRCASERACSNLSTRPFPADATYGRRLVRLGAQLCAADGTLINRDFARAELPRTLGRGDAADIAVELPALRRAGALRDQVRSGQRRGGLVRAVRIGNDGRSRSGSGSDR